jgi:type IV pilus assembly protein PilO
MWQKLQPREKILLAVLGVCLVIFAVFYFLLLPQYDTFTKNRQALAELEAKVKAADKVLASERAERDLALKAAEELNEVKSVFNNRMTDGLAVTYIGMEATRTNVRIDSFVPAGIVNKGNYLELPIKIRVSGVYPNVVKFIDKIEGLSNLADLRSLNIKPAKEAVTTVEAAVESLNKKQSVAAPGTDQKGRVTAEFDLVIYSSDTPEEPLNLEQIAGWQLGRQNAFQTPDGASPYAGAGNGVLSSGTYSGNGDDDLLRTFVEKLLNQSAADDNPVGGSETNPTVDNNQ